MGHLLETNEFETERMRSASRVNHKGFENDVIRNACRFQSSPSQLRVVLRARLIDFSSLPVALVSSRWRSRRHVTSRIQRRRDSSFQHGRSSLPCGTVDGSISTAVRFVTRHRHCENVVDSIELHLLHDPPLSTSPRTPPPRPLRPLLLPLLAAIRSTLDCLITDRHSTPDSSNQLLYPTPSLPTLARPGPTYSTRRKKKKHGQKPTQRRWKRLKQTERHLAGVSKMTWGLQAWSEDGKLKIDVHAQSDWASDPEGSRRVEG